MNKREKRKLAKRNAANVIVKLLMNYCDQGAPEENNDDPELAQFERVEIERLMAVYQEKSS